jgi:virginiamycin B lyase
MTELTLPQGWAPYAVAGDPDGNLWTTILDPPGLARVAAGDVRHEPLGERREPRDVRHEPLDGRPMLLAVTADGTVWCTRSDDRLIRRDRGGVHAVIETSPGSAPYGIAAAHDGGVWFTAPGLNRIGRSTASGDLTMIDLPVPDARAAMITVAEDGSAWAALNGAEALARVAGGMVEIVELPGGRAPAAPVGITAAKSGIWYADIAGGCVGLVDPSGAVSQFSFDDPACRPHAVAAGPDGGCWVTLWGSGQLARVTTDGDVTLHDLPGREPHGLWFAGPVVWVAMESGSLVAVPTT